MMIQWSPKNSDDCKVLYAVMGVPTRATELGVKAGPPTMANATLALQWDSYIAIQFYNSSLWLADYITIFAVQ